MTPTIEIEHDPFSAWEWDRAALARACERLRIVGKVIFRQHRGLMTNSETEGNLGRTRSVPGVHEIEVDPMLDEEAANGVTWHELSHAGDSSVAQQEGTYRRLVQHAQLCQFLGIYEGDPCEVKARETSAKNGGIPLVRRVREAPSYGPHPPCWKEVC